MNRLIIATRNKGKLAEIAALLGSTCEIVGAASLDASYHVEENADSFEGNALKKASLTSERFGSPCLADDSGLVVDALGGAPGVHSARFGGPALSDTDRCRLLLEKMSGTPEQERNARFCAVLAYAVPGTEPITFSGTLEGRIGLSLEGEQGFGYDPVFVPTGYDRSLAVLGPSIKNSLSHRARALAAFTSYIRTVT